MNRLLLLITICISSVSFGQVPDIEWQKSLGGTLSDNIICIQQTTDGGYIAAGSSLSSDGDLSVNQGGTDVWLIKLDILGNIIWSTSLGGIVQDGSFSIEQTNDEGYIVAAQATSNTGDIIGYTGNGDTKAWVIKLNSLGAILWQKIIGGSGTDRIWDIHQTIDDGYIAAGYYSNGNSGNSSLDAWVFKLDSIGNITWENYYGGSNEDQVTSIKQTMDGGYIFTGYSSSNDGDVSTNYGGYDIWVAKLDSNGIINWEKNFGGTSSDLSYSIQQTSNGGFIISGNTVSSDVDVSLNNGGSDIWVLKLDVNGNLVWENTYGGTMIEGYRDKIIQTADGGYIVSATSRSNDINVSGNYGMQDAWIIKLDSVGNITWEKNFGGSQNDWATSIHQSLDGSYIFAGISMSNDFDVSGNHGEQDGWVVKLCTSSLVTETVTECDSYTWNTNGQTYTQSGQYTEVLPNQNGCDSTITLDLTINSSTSSTQTDTGVDSYTWSVNNQTYTQSGTYTAVIPNASGCDSTITLNLTLQFTGLDENESSYVAVYPNPTYNSFTLSTKDMIHMNYTLVDLQGKVVLTGKIESTEETVDISKLSKGQYNLVFEDESISPISIIKN